MKPYRSFRLILVVLAVLLASCSPNSPAALIPQTGGSAAAQPVQSTPAPAAAPAAAAVTIHLFSFHPAEITVPVGTTVTWTNQDDIEHTITQGTPGSPSGLFDSAPFGLGKSFSYTFTRVGDYPYYCRRHESMLGMVKVVPAP